MRDEKTILLQILKDADIEKERKLLQRMDCYTWHHSIQTCLYATCIGQELSLPADALFCLAEAAFLHDVGKCFLDRRLLLKPGPINAEERKQIYLHTVFGRDCLEKNKAISPLIPLAAYEHHENEDGSGYPEQKTGSAIHPFSKIIHTADVYDALLSRRPYKKELPSQEAFAILLSDAGIRFDPETVDALKQILLKRKPL